MLVGQLLAKAPVVARGNLAALLVREFSIAEATLVMMTAFGVSAVLGTIQQTLFNAQFGAGAEASAFYAALRLRDVFYAVLTGRALGSALIPVLVAERATAGERGAWRLVNLVLTGLVCGLALLVIACEVLTPWIVSAFLAPGVDQQRSDLTVALIRIVLLQPLILAFGSVATVYLNSLHRFFLASLSVAGINLGLIVGIVAARLVPSLGVYGPALGVLLGAVLQVAIVLPELRSSGIRLRPAWAPSNARLHEVGRLLAPTSASAFLGYLGVLLDTAFASTAPEAAAVPAVYNGWLLVTLPISMLGRAVGQSAFPHLAKTALVGDWSKLRRVLVRTIALVISVGLLTVLLLIVFGRPLIGVLFEHGQFDASAGSLTYEVLAAYALGLPAYCGTEVAVRGLLALRKAHLPLLVDLGQLAARAACITLLIDRIGVVAVPLAFAGTSLVEFVVLLALLWLTVSRQMRTAVAAAR